MGDTHSGAVQQAGADDRAFVGAGLFDGGQRHLDASEGVRRAKAAVAGAKESAAQAQAADLWGDD